jgi:hypothetical protein
MKRKMTVFRASWLLGAFTFLCLGTSDRLHGATQTEPQRTFASPGDATNALVQAARSHDHRAIRQIFGPEVTNLLTGDRVLDDDHFDQFTKDVTERCVVVPEGNAKVILEIGQKSWPFPIPLVQTNGTWMFDTAAGEEEIVNRHIGRDEYYAIGVCRSYVKAQREFAAQFGGPNGTPRYAMQFESTPGKMDGLYWPTENGATPSPLSPLVAQSCLQGYHWANGEGPRPFHGYVFKILTSQGPAAQGGKMNYVHDGQMTGGFALVAYPVRWGESGIMTFIVNQDGTVYQQSLGENTPRIASHMTEYNPDPSWSVVKETGMIVSQSDESGR